MFLLLLCNDRAILGPWVNPRWLNAVGVIVVGGLVELSTLLVLTTLFPGSVCGSRPVRLQRRSRSSRPRA